MKREIDTRAAIALIAVVVIVLGVVIWRQFGNSAASSTAISPQQAGLGRPMYPPGAGAALGSAPGSGSPGPAVPSTR